MLIPTIDLMDGKAVQLRQGMEKVLEREDVIELAKYYGRFGEVAVIDIDAAAGNGKGAPCRVGGGIRDANKAQNLLSWGAKKIIIGTAANEELLSKLPKEKVLIAIDSKDGYIATHGWTKTTSAEPLDFVKRFTNLCSGFLYTVIENEGMMQGADIDSIKLIRAATTKELIAAGGICSVDEIVKLQKMGVHTQLGMCLRCVFLKLALGKKIRIHSNNCSGLFNKTGIVACLFHFSIAFASAQNRQRDIF